MSSGKEVSTGKVKKERKKNKRARLPHGRQMPYNPYYYNRPYVDSSDTTDSEDEYYSGRYRNKKQKKTDTKIKSESITEILASTSASRPRINIYSLDKITTDLNHILNLCDFLVRSASSDYAALDETIENFNNQSGTDTFDITEVGGVHSFSDIMFETLLPKFTMIVNAVTGDTPKLTHLSVAEIPELTELTIQCALVFLHQILTFKRSLDSHNKELNIRLRSQLSEFMKIGHNRLSINVQQDADVMYIFSKTKTNTKIPASVTDMITIYEGMYTYTEACFKNTAYHSLLGLLSDLKDKTFAAQKLTIENRRLKKMPLDLLHLQLCHSVFSLGRYETNTRDYDLADFLKLGLNTMQATSTSQTPGSIYTLGLNGKGLNDIDDEMKIDGGSADDIAGYGKPSHTALADKLAETFKNLVSVPEDGSNSLYVLTNKVKDFFNEFNDNDKLKTTDRLRVMRTIKTIYNEFNKILADYVDEIGTLKDMYHDNVSGGSFGGMKNDIENISTFIKGTDYSKFREDKKCANIFMATHMAHLKIIFNRIWQLEGDIKRALDECAIKKEFLNRSNNIRQALSKILVQQIISPVFPILTTVPVYLFNNLLPLVNTLRQSDTWTNLTSYSLEHSNMYIVFSGLVVSPTELILLSDSSDDKRFDFFSNRPLYKKYKTDFIETIKVLFDYAEMYLQKSDAWSGDQSKSTDSPYGQSMKPISISIKNHTPPKDGLDPERANVISILDMAGKKITLLKKSDDKNTNPSADELRCISTMFTLSNIPSSYNAIQNGTISQILMMIMEPTILLHAINYPEKSDELQTFIGEIVNNKLTSLFLLRCWIFSLICSAEFGAIQTAKTLVLKSKIKRIEHIGTMTLEECLLEKFSTAIISDTQKLIIDYRQIKAILTGKNDTRMDDKRIDVPRFMEDLKTSDEFPKLSTYLIDHGGLANTINVNTIKMPDTTPTPDGVKEFEYVDGTAENLSDSAALLKYKIKPVILDNLSAYPILAGVGVLSIEKNTTTIRQVRLDVDTIEILYSI